MAWEKKRVLPKLRRRGREGKGWGGWGGGKNQLHDTKTATARVTCIKKKLVFWGIHSSNSPRCLNARTVKTKENVHLGVVPEVHSIFPRPRNCIPGCVKNIKVITMNDMCHNNALLKSRALLLILVSTWLFRSSNVNMDMKWEQLRQNMLFLGCLTYPFCITALFFSLSL